MKKFLNLIIVILIFAFIYPDISLAGTINVGIWTEYASNPLFGGPTDGVNRGYYPCAIKVGSTYHIWYGDGTNTRHATNTSPNFSGSTFPAGIVTGIQAGAYHPRVLYNISGWTVGGIFYAGPFLMYATTGSDWNLSPKIYHSADGDSWTYIGDCSGVNSYGGNTSIYNFDVLYEGGSTWKAYTDNGFGYIQYYISTDGKNWTGTAINVTGSNLQSWETFGSFTSPHVIKYGNYYIMFYGSGTTNNNQALGMAISTDGQNFTKSTGNPILSKFNSPPSWRDDRTYTPYVLQDGSNWIMYFTGKSITGGIYSIGYATNTGIFCLIQEAINVANNGDVINVGAGTYKEQININKGISLIGDAANPDNVIIDGENKTTLPSYGQVRIYNPTGNVVFKGFKIINGGRTSSSDYFAILLKEGLSRTIENCKIIGHYASVDIGSDYGIWAYTSTGELIIKNTYFSDMYHAILLEQQYGASTIENNTFNHLYTGLYSGSIYGGRAIEAINYGTTDVTSLQKVSGNIFTNFKSTGVLFSGGFSGQIPRKFTNVIIENNNFNFSTTDIINNFGAVYLKNVSTPSNNDPNGGVTAQVLNNFISVPSGSGIQVLGLNGNIDCHENNIYGNPYCFKADGTLTTTIDATNNWWGTAVESEILAKIYGTILYDPWIGKTQPPPDNNIPVSVTPTPISLPNSNATIQFNNLGVNNINPTITVQKVYGIPGTPASAGTPMPVYFIVTATNLVNYTFEATIVLDISDVAGFTTNTVFMTSPNGTGNWVASTGTYNSSAQTYSFTTNHFSYIAFVNPVSSNQINLYVSTSTSSYDNTIYPNIGWNTPLSTGTGDAFNWTPSASNHDWTYKSRTGSYYIVPVGATSTPRTFNVATIKLVWNPSVVSGVTVTEGNFFNDGGKTSIFTTNSGSNWVIIDASCLEQNQTPGSGKYIAKLDFVYNTGSGASPVAIDNVTLLYMEGSNEYEVMTVTQNMGGKLKFYLGDFASTTPSSEDTGDGLINGTDLMGFSNAYWSNYNDAPTTLYKSKYDIGPTTPTRYYFGNPVPDGTIGFEDLAIFTMGYSKTGSGTLPDNPAPVKFSLDKIAKENGTLRLPVRISGNVNDVRAFSMKIKYGNDMEYTGVEMAGEMLEGVKFLIGKSESNTAYMDGAVLGEYEAGLSREGIIAYVLFNEKTNTNHSASIESAIARNSGNLDLEVQIDGDNNGLGIPKTYSLNQNYPNPFNPVTKIEYAIPNDIKVTIKIYDVLGREVNVLVNEVQTAGYYAINWNASNLSSGIYFYQMKAGNFYAVKKMMLIK